MNPPTGSNQSPEIHIVEENLGIRISRTAFLEYAPKPGKGNKRRRRTEYQIKPSGAKTLATWKKYFVSTAAPNSSAWQTSKTVPKWACDHDQGKGCHRCGHSRSCENYGRLCKQGKSHSHSPVQIPLTGLSRNLVLVLDPGRGREVLEGLMDLGSISDVIHVAGGQDHSDQVVLELVKQIGPTKPVMIYSNDSGTRHPVCCLDDTTNCFFAALDANPGARQMITSQKEAQAARDNYRTVEKMGASATKPFPSQRVSTPQLPVPNPPEIIRFLDLTKLSTVIFQAQHINETLSFAGLHPAAVKDDPAATAALQDAVSGALSISAEESQKLVARALYYNHQPFRGIPR
jgi:hypothetical protein